MCAIPFICLLSQQSVKEKKQRKKKLATKKNQQILFFFGCVQQNVVLRAFNFPNKKGHLTQNYGTHEKLKKGNEEHYWLFKPNHP